MDTPVDAVKQCHGHSRFDLPLPTPRRALRVGTILDPFTDLAFSYEWHQVPLTPDNWRTRINGLDLLFVESAWHGNSDSWQYQLTGSAAPSQQLRALVSECQNLAIPTVFWNKEDPYHFDDFIDTARLFDWTFTTEAKLVTRYVQELGHDRVGALLFAAQPAIHNPSGSLPPENRRGVCFAGTYFSHKFPERRDQIEMLLDGALTAQKDGCTKLEIFSRFQDLSDTYRFPDRYQPFVSGELNYEEMLSAYRAYECFLNVNSIPDSQTMFSRRVFEVLACGTPVISAPSPALEPIFGQGVIQVQTSEDAANWIKALHRSPALRDELTYEARMRILMDHTYSHRVDDVLRFTGLDDFVIGEPEVSIIVSTNRPYQVDHLLRQVAHQVGVKVQLLLGTHGFGASEDQVSTALNLGLDAQWIEIDAGISLGSVYNLLISRADCPLIAKFDDDDDYGPYYLLEQTSAIASMGADLCGKQSHLVRIHYRGKERLIVTYPGQEHKFTSFVSGPTFLTTAEVMKEIGFEDLPRGEDTALLRTVSASGGKVFTTGRHGFVQNRLGTAHTWSAPSVELLRHSTLIESPVLTDCLSDLD